MARRGRFGRLPRSAPSLTNTLVAIAREMQAQRDQNLMSAWQKGGTFEGKPATDELVLAHWRERLKGVAKDDPLADTYKNTITQYTYAIAESKASTEYAQGKRTDAEMASFYLNWSKKVPKNSEFYRVLQRDGAQFMRASKAKGVAAAKAAAEKAYHDAQDATSKRYEQTGLYLADVVTQMAKSRALIGKGDNENLSKFDPSDPAAMLDVLSQVMGTARGGPNAGKAVPMSTVLFHDPLTGKAVTGRDIVAKLGKLDPHFDGNFTADYFSHALDQQGQGQAIRLKRADATGHATDVNNIRQWQQYTSEIGRESKAWPVEKAYMSARQRFLETWQSTTASPESKTAAWDTYAHTLGRLAADPRIKTDDATQARLKAELTGNGSVDSLAESFTGLSSANAGQGGGPTDITQTHAWLKLYQESSQAVAAGKEVWAYGSYNDQGQFTPGKGNEVGATDPVSAQNAGPAGSVVVYVPQSNGAKAIPVYVPGKPVTVNIVDQDGFKVTGTNPNDQQVGKVYDLVINGQSVRMYSYKTSDGREMFTRDAPWGSAAGVNNGPNGVELNITVQLPKNPNTGAVDASQIKPGDPYFTKDAKGNIFVNGMNVVKGTDPARAKAGVDPLTDSFSPTLAALMTDREGQKTLSDLSNDPTFTAQIDSEARVNAGQVYDPATNTWAGGNAGVLAVNQQQGYITQHVTETGNLDGPLHGLFDRTSTKEAYGSASTPGVISKIDNAPLPSDKARETPFAPLAGVFMPGSMAFRPSDKMAGDTFNIQTAGTIKVPSLATRPGGSIAPTPAPTPGPTTVTVNPNVPQAAPQITPSTPASSAPQAGGAPGAYRPPPTPHTGAR